MKKSVLKNRPALIVTTLIAIAALAGAAYWYQISATAAEPTEAALQTTKVRTGDLVISASGGGNILPQQQADLGFRSSGILKEISAVIGEKVTQGQILASLEDNLQQAQLAQAEADFQALFSEASLAQTKIALANAEIAHQTAAEELQYLISPEVYYWEIEIEKANLIKNDTQSTAEQKIAAETSLQRAETNLQAAQERYQAEYVPGNFTYTYIDLETEEEITTMISPTPIDIALARAKVDSAYFAVVDARSLLEIIQAGAQSISGPVVAVQGSQTAKIEQARLALENARLNLANTHIIAPFDGVVIGLDAVVGQTVNTSPMLTLATTQDLQVRFYLDETDLDKAKTGNKIIISFDAFPDTQLTGQITAVEQTLQVIDGTPAIVSWASFENPDNLPILSGMTVDVEVIGGQAQNALLVPIQALRKIAPGSYAVFVVQSDGSLKLTSVQVGLRDFANAVILSGVKAGDVISTGTVETK
jgi:RND family efflux transporter MFP subunit